MAMACFGREYRMSCIGVERYEKRVSPLSSSKYDMPLLFLFLYHVRRACPVPVSRSHVSYIRHITSSFILFFFHAARVVRTTTSPPSQIRHRQYGRRLASPDQTRSTRLTSIPPSLPSSLISISSHSPSQIPRKPLKKDYLPYPTLPYPFALLPTTV